MLKDEQQQEVRTSKGNMFEVKKARGRAGSIFKNYPEEGTKNKHSILR